MPSNLLSGTRATLYKKVIVHCEPFDWIGIDVKRHLARRLAILLAGLAVLVATSFLRIPVDPAEPFATLGRSLARLAGDVGSIEGEARLSLLPRPRLEIARARITFANGMQVEAKQVGLDLGIWSLIGGRYEPVAMHLDRPVIAMPPALVPSGPTAASAALTSISSRLLALRGEKPSQGLDTVTVTDGRILDASLDHATPIFSNVAGTAHVSGSDALSLDGGFAWRGHPIAATVALGEAGSAKDGARTLAIALAGDLATIKLTGTASAGQKPALDGRLALDIKDPQRFAQWLDLPSLRGIPAITLSGDAHAGPEAIKVAGAALTIGTVPLTGSVSFDASGAVPRVTGTLAAGDMDVTDTLSPLWPKGEATVGWRRDPFEPGLVPAYDLDFRLSAERVNLGIVRISDVALSIMAKNGALDATLASSHLFQGAAKGKVSLTPSSGYAGYDVKAHAAFDAIDIGQMTLALMDIRRIEGSAAGSFDLAAHGQSSDEWMKSIAGTAELAVSNGTLIGVNLPGLLRRIETRPLAAVRDMKGGKTGFDIGRFSTRLNEGTARLENAEILFPPNRMTLSGAIKIGARSLALDGQANGASDTGEATKAILPFTITGSFDDPVVTPDVGRILRGAGSSTTDP